MILHILRKDIRRLWLPVVVTWALLAALARADRWRSDFTPGFVEGWLNLLLPLAWAYLVAVAVQEESPVGDRQFWITRPYRWPVLLGAKIIFVALSIHLPAFLADCGILAARGFHPLEYLLALVWKQFLLACWLTIPAAALAASVRNLAHFMLVALVLCGGAVLMGGALDRISLPYMPADAVRNGLALLPLAVAAVAVVLLQYVGRRTAVSRVLGAAAALTAAALYGYTPREYTAVLGATLHSGDAGNRGISLQAAPQQGRPKELGYGYRPNAVLIAVPLAAAGVPDGVTVRFEQLALEIAGPGGDRYAAAAMSRFVRADNPALQATIAQWESRGTWQFVWINRPTYDQLKKARVRLIGKATATLYRPGETTWMPVGGNAQAAGVGRCFTILQDDRIGQQGLKVVCESPSEIPLFTHIRIWHPETGMDWKGGLSEGGMSSSYPKETWLSPLNRRQGYYQVTEEPARYEGSRWLVPRSALATARIEISPEHATGSASFRYEIPDLTLSDFVVAPARQ